jgi:TonB family protein
MTVIAASREVEYLYNPPPDYPPRARRRGLEGEVLIRARVHPDGECGELVLQQSSGHALLDQAAMEAVRMWRFRPARRGDERVARWVEIPVRFGWNTERSRTGALRHLPHSFGRSVTPRCRAFFSGVSDECLSLRHIPLISLPPAA